MSYKIKTHAQHLTLFVFILLFLLSTFQPSLYAISPEQRKLLNRNIQYLDPSATASPTCSAGPGSPSSGGMPSDYANSDIKTFASQSISSTWNISDSAAESWFLEQGSVNNGSSSNGLVKGVIPRYGLNASNIGEITAVVKESGVSPVFFYVYSVSEGGGLGGFINHFSRDKELSGGVANAKRDAEYIVEIANSTGHPPAWQDLGTSSGNGNFVPSDIQTAGNADFANMPTGTIGRIYIPATAAVAWEVYYPDGLKGSVNGVQDYGAPLKALMNSITRMGGDPMVGGATVSAGSCTNTNTVVGEGITKAMNWAIMIANNDGYGYDQPGRATGWEKWQSDQALGENCTTNCGSFDCSSLISAALTYAGYYDQSPNFHTAIQGNSLQGAGFTNVFSSTATSENLLPGDILLGSGHTAMYIGDNKIVHASQNENKGISGGQVGDQTGKEILVASYYDHPWTSVWRAPN